MAMRDLVAGAPGCGASTDGASSSSNPLGNFMDSVLGGSSKQQERLHELPGLMGLPEVSDAERHQQERLRESVAHFAGPGVAGSRDDAHAEDFMRGFQSLNLGTGPGLEAAWHEASTAAGPSFHRAPPFAGGVVPGDFEAVWDEQRHHHLQHSQSLPAPHAGAAPAWHARDEVLSGVLSSFFRAGPGGVFRPAAPLPELGLSAGDKERIRNRSAILGRHVYGERGDAHADAQVAALLQSLRIEGVEMGAAPAGRLANFHDVYNEASRMREVNQRADSWASEFEATRPTDAGTGADWAGEFHASRADAWATEFGQGRLGERSAWVEEFEQTSRPVAGSAADVASREQTAALADVLRRNPEPKFQNSNFLRFVSKMSRGEIVFEDNRAVERDTAERWTDQFVQEAAVHDDQWAAEFGQMADAVEAWDAAGDRQSSGWASEFAAEQSGLTSDAWVEEFSSGVATHTEEWAAEFDGFQGVGEVRPRGQYVFAVNNPYISHVEPLAEGKDLFRRGVLSEAVLALEAEVQRNPESCEGWRLLGMAQAENDDDIQAIAAMARALQADPTNLEVLLSLGVSHTNELAQREALGYLIQWLRNHSAYAHLVPVAEERSDPAGVAEVFRRAAEVAPNDADVHTVLGVLYNLARNYASAVAAFERALEIKPMDYSLWNKLGATKANSARSAEAIDAYQRALDLKPNYVRAWSNMGIGYANQGRYEESAAYYVRALQMNGAADHLWNYLKLSISCANRMDLMDAVDRRDLPRLEKEFPL